MGQYKHSNDLRNNVVFRCTINRYYDLLKQQQQLKELQIQRNEMTDEKIPVHMMFSLMENCKYGKFQKTCLRCDF